MRTAPPFWVRLLPRAVFGSLVALSCIALIGQLGPIISYHTQNLAIYVNRGSHSGRPDNGRRGAYRRAYEPVEPPFALLAGDDAESFFVRGMGSVASKAGELSRNVSVRALAPENATEKQKYRSVIRAPSGERHLENGTNLKFGRAGVRELHRLTDSQNVSRHLSKDGVKRNASEVVRNDTAAKLVPKIVVEVKDVKPKANETRLPKIPDSYAIVHPAMKKRILLIAYFRSGSSFLGGLLSSTSNRTFFSYEPLSLLSTAERLKPQTAPRGLEILANHLTCHFLPMADYLAVAPKRWNHYAYNVFLMKLCGRKVKVCLNPQFMADVCRRSPIQVVKVTRLSVVQVLQWLRFNAPLRGNLKVVYLVRDPRGVISSRNVMSWCRKSAKCMNASSLCREMNEDLDAFEELGELLPKAAVRVRYEDIAKSADKESKALFDALGLEFSAGVKDFLRTHTVANDTKLLRNPYSTVRHSSINVLKWTKKLKWNRVKEIQNACAPVLKRLGYKVFPNEKEFRNASLRQGI
ncbi:hypothetical protein HPB50_021536 [Hyalomma asiaticum]|uniref:Uncharacterized protein n=1 Tax=Hyalomma asiaticum TaxID=266040 RepID=A0ACB7RL21_HYAAI|nr:hypothetical protein HPB50_021536 [Hyalomma asiaticum]